MRFMAISKFGNVFEGVKVEKGDNCPEPITLYLQDNLWDSRLFLHCGKSGNAGTKGGQPLEFKINKPMR